MQAVYELKKSYIPDLFPEISLPAFLAMKANTINALIDNMLHSTSCFFLGGGILEVCFGDPSLTLRMTGKVPGVR